MTVHLIVPVGVSLMDWIHREVPDFRAPRSWVRRDHQVAEEDRLMPSHDTGQVAAILTKRLDAESQSRTCAEIDSSLRWIEQKLGAADVAAVDLLVSDTEAGSFVAEVLAELLGRLLPVAKIRRVAVSNVDPRSAGFEAGLRDYVRETAQALRAAWANGSVPVINATAGFKAESGLSLLLGLLMGTKVFYLYEGSDTIVEFPPLPLDWQVAPPDLMALRRLGEAAGIEDAYRAGIRGRDHLWPFISTQDDLLGLSAFGQMLLDSISTQGSPVDLVPRNEGDSPLEIANDEIGHAPADCETLADRIVRACNFVKSARVTRWNTPSAGREGVRAPLPKDQRDGLIRLGLRSRDGRLVHFLLITTADPETWDEARARVAEKFGWVSLAEQFREVDPRSEEREPQNPLGGELAQVEAIGTACAQVAELDEWITEREQLRARLEKAEGLAAKRSEELRRARDDVRYTRDELRRSREELAKEKRAKRKKKKPMKRKVKGTIIDDPE